mmetsp:Transcript_16067/g.50413  ORF Transcript_16067/g.50413 Transcript_16067/m.50413 type:complete len:241 (-) Transcript_16067:129-851(-)
MASAIDHVEGRHRNHKLVGGLACKLRHALVEGLVLAGCCRAADGHAHGENRIGTELLLAPAPLVLRAVQLLVHHLVELALLEDILTEKLGRDDLVDVLHSREHALAQVAGGVLVPELQRLVDARGGAAGHRRSEEVHVRQQVDLDGGVPPGVEDLARLEAHDPRRPGDDAVNNGHVAGEIDEAVGVAPLIVIPGHELHKRVVQGDARSPVEDGRELAGVEVCGDDVVLGVGQDALHRPRS